MAGNISNNAYSDEQIMLTLAAISYRGYNLTLLPAAAKRARLLSAMQETLDTLSPVKNEWKIVWGPVGFTSTTIGFDDSAMYVAENLKKPVLAIAVRGTNPVSLFDWMFGDLAAYKTVPWPYSKAAPGAEISLSTALGLGVLQHLHDNPAAGVTRPAPALGTIFDKLGDAFRGASAEIRRLAGGSIKLPTLEDWAAAVRQRSAKEAGDAVFQALDARLQGLLSQHFDPLASLSSAIEEHAASAPGVDLRTFLTNTVSHDRYDLYVTGHSKGAALSSTLALWLADTQGRAASEEDQWDVNGNAKVHAYSFAGPTAGNGKFAAHSNSVIGDRCWRVANAKDIVPRAWNDLKAIPDLYGSSGRERELLSQLCDGVAPSVAKLDYQQICSGGQVHEFTGRLLPQGTLFLAQAIHQHLDAYLEELHLAPEMDLTTFFTPVL